MMDSGGDDNADGRIRSKLEALASTTRRALRAVEETLAQYSLEVDNIHNALESLRELLDTDKVLLHTLEQRPGTSDLRVARAATARVPSSAWRESLDDYLTGRGFVWGPYNALSPEPSQRDRVLDAAQVHAVTEGRSRDVQRFMLERLDAVGSDTMRVLICDGPSLLAWIGIVQPQKTTMRQRDLFELAVPAFRKRLMFDRLVAETAFARGTVAAALEQVSGSAWLLGPSGRVEHANSAGRAQLDADHGATLNSLERCLAGNAGPRFTVARVIDGGRTGHVIVEATTRAAHGVPQAAVRLGLTPAQTRVLERVARGSSNATIAADLKVAERTVEAHVTAILEKAQVPSRAALLVQIFA